MDGDRWWEAEGWESDLSPFVILMRAFLDDRISAAEFERLYLRVFKTDTQDHSEEIFETLQAVFFAVDDFVLEDDLRAGLPDIDASQLHSIVTLLLERLRKAKDSGD